MPTINSQIARVFIKNNFNKTQTTKELKPHLTNYHSINSHCSEVVTRGVVEEARRIIAETVANDPELNPVNLLNGFKEDLKANKTVFYKGKRYDDIKDNPVRASTRMGLLERLYLKGADNAGISLNDNRQINLNIDLEKLETITAELKSLTSNAKEISEKLLTDTEL